VQRTKGEGKWKSKITQAIAMIVLMCRLRMDIRQGGDVLKHDAWLYILI
jgi:hypothetical protein